MAIQFLIFTLVFLSIILLLYFLGVVISHLIYTIKLNRKLSKFDKIEWFDDKIEKENKDNDSI